MRSTRKSGKWRVGPGAVYNVCTVMVINGNLIILVCIVLVVCVSNELSCKGWEFIVIICYIYKDTEQTDR